ncbi:hypothetical protein, partial [Mesorhizobium australicum]
MTKDRPSLGSQTKGELKSVGSKSSALKGLEMDESLKPDHQGAPQGEWGHLSFSLPAARLNMWAPDAATKSLARDPKIERCHGKGSNLHSFICHHPDFAHALQQRAAQRSRLSPLATKSSKAIRRVET